MPLKLALGVRGTVAGHRLGALDGGWCTSPHSNASLPLSPAQSCRRSRGTSSAQTPLPVPPNGARPHPLVPNAGAASLAEAIRSNCSLTELALKQNQIGDMGTIALAEALHQNTLLTSLNLEFNRIAGVEAALQLEGGNFSVLLLHACVCVRACARVRARGCVCVQRVLDLLSTAWGSPVRCTCTLKPGDLCTGARMSPHTTALGLIF